MKKKQKVAYILALLLGFASVFGGGILPLKIDGVSVVHADAVTPAVYNKNSSIVYVDDDGFCDIAYDKDNPDTVEYNGNTYRMGSSIKGDHYLMDFINSEDSDDYIIVDYGNLFTDITASSTGNAVLTISADYYDETTDSEVPISFSSSTVTIPIEKHTYTFDEQTMSLGENYSLTVNRWYDFELYFTPSTSENYTFNLSGSGVAYYASSVDSESGKWTPLESDTYGYYKSYTESKTFSLIANQKYCFDVFRDLSSLDEGEWNYYDKDITVSVKITSSSTKGSTAVASSTNQNSSSSTTSSRTSSSATSSTTYSSSSSSSSSSGSSSSSSSSFSKGDSRTVGSGSSAADYVRTGTTTVRYDASAVSSKATSATVPATVKIGGKTYRVTTISAGAFKDNTKLKTVTIGKNIKTIGKGAFSGCTNLKTLTINSRNLTKKSVKGALSGSSVKTVRVPANKVDSYKNIFTKANTGSKGKVTVKAKKK